MKSFESQAIKSFNEQLHLIKQKANELKDQQLLLSIATFNEKVTLIADRKDPLSFEELSRKTYQPEGKTALYDAIGISVTRLIDQMRSEIESGNATAMVLIITGGMDNASDTFDQAAVNSIIKECESTKQWSFSFIGSTPREIGMARWMEMQHGKSINLRGRDFNITFEENPESTVPYFSEKQIGMSNIKFENKNEIIMTDNEKKSLPELKCFIPRKEFLEGWTSVFGSPATMAPSTRSQQNPEGTKEIVFLRKRKNQQEK